MIAALKGIVDALAVGLSFIQSFFKGLISFFTLAFEAVAFVVSLLSSLPSVLLLFASAMIAIVVVLHLLGR